ncbi:cytochrome P450 [Viridothelium virens]|uniref:Cytochrome P450 n=1 Tax=Viridothelium virens TaxID=1048519 RepID=A0A6A6H6T6_VIRVR|nr:cytochrome P450 [Viridothelium virens]
MWIEILCFVLTLAVIYVCSKLGHSRTLAAIPGPPGNPLTSFLIDYLDLQGCKTRHVASLHKKYGPVVCIASKEVSLSSHSAVPKIYTIQSEKTSFYDMFIVFNERTHFTMINTQEHKNRRRPFASLYAALTVSSGETEILMDTMTMKFIDALAKQIPLEKKLYELISPSILDFMTAFIYGNLGATAALESSQDNQINDDLKAPGRRLLFFAFNQFPVLAEWATIAINKLGLSNHFPTRTYPQLFSHGWHTWQSFDQKISRSEKLDATTSASVIAQAHDSGITGTALAAECADQLLAALIALNHVLISALWVLSQPSQHSIQSRLHDELRALPPSALDSAGNPSIQTCSKLPYLNAVMKETLRLYPPFSGAQPRRFRSDVVIDGYVIPAGTSVSMCMYAMHRNPEVFPEPERFWPERWLDVSEGRMREMERYFWPFSAGDRRCTGEQ